MADKKSEVGELRALLRSLEIQRDPTQYEQVVQKVIAYMTLGVDVSPLFSEMIMAGATQNIVQKKMVYLYLSNYAEHNSDLALLTINTLKKDASDRNPTVRGLALRSMTSLRVPNIVEYIREPILSGLNDKSGYVRKTAVIGVLKLFYTAPEVISDMNLVDVLYKMIKDTDPHVVCNCLTALEEILANEGGIVVTKKLAQYLINRLRDFSEWGQCQVLQLLLKYNSTDQEEILDLLNALDDRLQHVMVGVVMGTIKLFLHLTENMPSVHAAVFDRVKAPLITLLGSAPPEVAYVCLQHIELFLSRNSTLFSEHHHHFYYRYNDPPYVKLKKLELLMQVSTEVNSKDVVEELGECATDINVQVAQKSIQAIGRIAIKLSSTANMCVDKLLSLLSMEIDHITSETVKTMTTILRKYENTHELILPRLSACYSVMSDPEGRASLIWIMGEYGESLDESPYLLEAIVNKIEEESSTEVKLQLQTAVMKLFFKRPPECQEMLGRLLEYTIEEETDMLIRDRGMLYYRLLKEDVMEAKKIVCGSHKIFSQFATHSQLMSLFREFNSLAISYTQSSLEFIEQSPPYTPTHNSSTVPSRMSDIDKIFMPVTDGVSNATTLLNSLSSRSTSSSGPPHILLNPTPTISATEFEQKWVSFNTSFKESFPLKYMSKLKILQEKLAEKFISTLACSPDGQPVMKMFLFSQHVSTMDQFLVELEITVASKMLQVTVKSDNKKLVEKFVLHLLDAMSEYIQMKK